MQIAFVLVLLVIATVLFAIEKFTVDVVALLLLCALVVSGILTTEEAFAGFSSDIIIILASIFIISGSLQETGVFESISSRILKLCGDSRNGLLLMLMSAASGASAFMNNTTVTAMLLPSVAAMAKTTKTNPSKLMMPLAFASIFGGTCTLIGTSTNVAVSGYIAAVGLVPLGLFEVTPIGLIITVVGIAYMLLIGQRLLPDRAATDLTTGYAIREYLSELIILPQSPLIGQRSDQWDLSVLDMRVLKVIREGEALWFGPTVRLAAGDVLLIEGKLEDLIRIQKIEGLEIKAAFSADDPAVQGGGFKLAEMLVMPQSEQANRTVRQTGFRQRYGVQVIAVHRGGESLREQISDIRLRVGDLLLVQGPEDRVDQLQREADMASVGEHKPPAGNFRKGVYTLAFFGAAIVTGGFGWTPMPVSFLLAALLAILVGSISIHRAHDFIDWRLLILIAGMTAFGTAMEKTGAADFLAGNIVAILSPAGPMAVLAGFFVLTIILTQPMSNAAAALVTLPVAISAATSMGLNERTFAIGVMLAASISFITPFEPSCILVYGPGRYKFRDYPRAGAGLTLILAIVVLVCVPIFWPL